jgi:hypothetical protein
MRAVAGTTFALAIGPDEPTAGGGNIGFGTELFADPQRGVLGVELRSGGVLRARVPVKLVTRLMPDPASPAGLSGELATPHPVFSSVSLLGQVAALIDLPHTLPEGSYQITIRRYRDVTLTTLVDEGPIESALWSDVLYVEAGDGSPHYTPFAGGWDILNFALDAEHVRQIVPYPQLLLNLPAGTAAATLDIGFPEAKVAIAGVYVYHATQHAVTAQLEPIDSDSVRIHFVDPAAQDYRLALVFENTQSGFAPVLLGEFSYEAGSFYDLSGTLIVPAAGFDPIGQIR